MFKATQSFSQWGKNAAELVCIGGKIKYIKKQKTTVRRKLHKCNRGEKTGREVRNGRSCALVQTHSQEVHDAIKTLRSKDNSVIIKQEHHITHEELFLDFTLPGGIKTQKSL